MNLVHPSDNYSPPARASFTSAIDNHQNLLLNLPTPPAITNKKHTKLILLPFLPLAPPRPPPHPPASTNRPRLIRSIAHQPSQARSGSRSATTRSPRPSGTATTRESSGRSKHSTLPHPGTPLWAFPGPSQAVLTRVVRVAASGPSTRTRHELRARLG